MTCAASQALSGIYQRFLGGAPSSAAAFLHQLIQTKSHEAQDDPEHPYLIVKWGLGVAPGTPAGVIAQVMPTSLAMEKSHRNNMFSGC